MHLWSNSCFIGSCLTRILSDLLTSYYSNVHNMVGGKEGFSESQCRWPDVSICDLWGGTGPSMEGTEHASASRARDYEPSATINSQSSSRFHSNWCVLKLFLLHYSFFRMEVASCIQWSTIFRADFHSNQWCSGSADCRTDDYIQAAWYNTPTYELLLSLTLWLLARNIPEKR